MAIAAMKKIHICAMKKDRKAVLEYLQGLSVVEIETNLDETDFFKRMNTSTRRAHYEKRVQNTEHALEIINTYAPEDKSIFASLEGKRDIKEEKYDDVVTNRHKLNLLVSEVMNLNKEIEQCDSDIARYNISIEGLKPWINMDIPINTEGTKKTKVFLGTMPVGLDEAKIHELVTGRNKELESYHVQVIGVDKDATYVFAMCLNEDAALFEETLRAEGFVKIPFFSHRTPEGKIKKYEQDIRDLEKKKQDTIDKIVELSKNREIFEILADYYTIRKDKYVVLGSIIQSESTFIITGYIPAKEAGKVEEKLNKKFSLYVEIFDLEEDEEPPIKLENKKFFTVGEGVLSSFGLPGKGEMDPTAPMSLCYIILFGLMLSDAAYGLIVFLACFIILKKYPKMSTGFANSIRLFMYCGLSTLFWGVLFGGYFGDGIAVISRVFFGHEVTIKPIWFEPIKEPMRMLIISLAIGLAHLFFGLILAGYTLIKKKDFVGLVSDVISWMMLITGLLLMLIPTSLFASIAQVNITFPDSVKNLSYALAIIGAVIIFLMSGRANKNPVVRLALGLYDLYNITGWVSDLLSYSRLLALGLATGVIAQVINQMGSMLGASVGGVIVFIIVFIIGHIFNMAVNLLGAYVHTCRLQYVEFFGKFYEGGGRPFTPFTETTKYVDVEDGEE
ncbi:MAG: V-type ATP synthase subunit I [Lachnospiraceae bacterium]|nr:V-type ATP synthase subunit I [Lachnospiraceae bacterium]